MWLTEWLDARGFFEMGGAVAVFSALMLGTLVFALPPERRSAVNRLLGLFALYLALFAIAQVFPSHVANTAWIRVAAFAVILLVVSRGSLLLATETRLGRWLLPPLPRILVDVLQGASLLLVGLLTLHAAGLEPGQLLTTSALLTAVVGLALQDTLGNLFSGLALQLGRPFEIGDWIDVDGDATRSGKVMEVGWRATRLLTLDLAEIIVPNGVLARSTIRNYTRPTTLERRHVRFSAAYATAPARVCAAVEEAVRTVANVALVPAPVVVVDGFADSAVAYDLWYHTTDHALALTTDALVRDRIWHALARARIPIPFPQRDVHLFNHDEERELRSRLDEVEQRVMALSGVDLFQVLDPQALHTLAERSISEAYASGEEVVRQGAEGNTLYVVRSGRVEVVLGRDQRIASLGAGAFFGEMSLLTGERRAATVRTVAETELVKVGHDALHDLLQHHPELFGELSTTLAERQVANESQSPNGTSLPKSLVEERSQTLLRRIREFFA